MPEIPGKASSTTVPALLKLKVESGKKKKKLGGDILEITVNWQRVSFRNNPANVSGTGSMILQCNLYQKQAASRIPLRLFGLKLLTGEFQMLSFFSLQTGRFSSS